MSWEAFPAAVEAQAAPGTAAEHSALTEHFASLAHSIEQLRQLAPAVDQLGAGSFPPFLGARLVGLVQGTAPSWTQGERAYATCFGVKLEPCAAWVSGGLARFEGVVTVLRRVVGFEHDVGSLEAKLKNLQLAAEKALEDLSAPAARQEPTPNSFMAQEQEDVKPRLKRSRLSLVVVDQTRRSRSSNASPAPKPRVDIDSPQRRRSARARRSVIVEGEDDDEELAARERRHMSLSSALSPPPASPEPVLPVPGTLPTVGQARSVEYFRRILSLPSTVDLDPPASLLIPDDVQLNFKMQLPNHLEGQGQQFMSLGLSGEGAARVYKRHKNFMSPDDAYNIMTVDGEKIAPGQPIFVSTEPGEAQWPRGALAARGLKTVSGAHVLGRAGGSWRTCMGWYDEAHAGSVVLPTGPGALDRLDPGLRRVLLRRMTPWLDKKTGLPHPDGVQSVADALEDYGFRSRTKVEALTELEDPSRAGQLSMHYLLFKCVDFDEASRARWERNRLVLGDKQKRKRKQTA
ncbi:hypothetical protein JCM8208_002067 [Rhodotorula glutinis]